MTTETLCANPVEIYLIGLGRVRCAYKPGESVLILSLNGVPHEHLSQYEKKMEICRNKVSKHFVGFLWSMTWVLMYSCHRVVVVASYNKKTKTFTVSAGGKNQTSKTG